MEEEEDFRLERVEREGERGRGRAVKTGRWRGVSEAASWKAVAGNVDGPAAEEVVAVVWSRVKWWCVCRRRKGKEANREVRRTLSEANKTTRVGRYRLTRLRSFTRFRREPSQSW